MIDFNTTNKSGRLLIYILGSTFISIFLILTFMHGALSSWQSFGRGFLWAFSISITQWIGLEQVYGLIDRRISWIQAPGKKIAMQIVSFISYSAIAFILIQFLNYYLWLNVLPAESWRGIIKSLPSTLLISFIISLIFTSIGFFTAWKTSFIQAEKLKAEMLAYKYESLRNQINPHFLFNSLNVLSDLVYDDQALAVKFIRQLSDLFRYVLDSRDKELVPLQEELDFIHSFTFLLKTRFEDKLKIEICMVTYKAFGDLYEKIKIANAEIFDIEKRKSEKRELMKRFDEITQGNENDPAKLKAIKESLKKKKEYYFTCMDHP